LLLGVVEWVRVKERPNELAADVLEAEFESGVLENGVMAAVEGCSPYVEALLVSDFFRRNKMIGITGTGGRDGGIKGMIKEVPESDAGRAGFDGFGWAGALKHSRLCGHDRTLFYTVAKQRHRREKRIENASPE